MSSILIGASILLLGCTEPIEPKPILAEEIALVAITTPQGLEFDPEDTRLELQTPDWQVELWNQMEAQGINMIYVGHKEVTADTFCVIRVEYEDGRVICWDGDQDSSWLLLHQ